MIGQQIAQYKILAKLGEGGMGSVYEGFDERIGKHVAIKVLHKDHAKNPQVSARFINEARAINHVDHPGIVQVIGSDSLADGTSYIVMELLKGETLNARLKASGGRMLLYSVLQLGRQLASALAAAHAKGIIHRDLKPDNIMLVADSAFPGGERTKLLDFGIAKLQHELQAAGAQVMTRAGVMMGTPLYMAPEQCRNARDVDDKADVYSLGVLLYRMLAGKPPFFAAGPGEVMAMHIYSQPAPLSDTDRALPQSLTDLIHLMLAKKREERPSMSQVEAELERIGAMISSAGPVVPAQPLPSSSARQPALVPSVHDSATVLSEPSRSHFSELDGPRRTWPLGLAGILLLTLSGGLVYYILRAPAAHPPAVAVPTKSALASKPVDLGSDLGQPKKATAKGVNWHIDSDPKGAEIYRVNGQELLGLTPLYLNSAPKAGLVTLELRIKGYQPARLILDGNQDAEPPIIKLEAEKPSHKRDHKKP